MKKRRFTKLCILIIVLLTIVACDTYPDFSKDVVIINKTFYNSIDKNNYFKYQLRDIDGTGTIFDDPRIVYSS